MVYGVPQGTVLGPLLFLLYINDLPSVVSSKVRLFADDCLIYRNIKNKEDQIALQKDLNLLENWGNTWGMRFNAAKCNIMRVSRTRDPKLFNYSLTGQVLVEVMDARYLGVTLSNDLEWSKHIATMTNKANSKLSFLRRNLKGCPEKLKQTAYFSLISSFMEYGALVEVYKGTRRKHNMKFRQIGHTTSHYGQLFFPKTISAWNGLAFAEAPSLAVFRSNFIKN